MKSRVLFICTGNSARSQMAEGLLRHMAGELFDTIHWAVDDPASGNRPMDFQLALKDLKTRLAYLVIIEEKRCKAGQGAAS